MNALIQHLADLIIWLGIVAFLTGLAGAAALICWALAAGALFVIQRRERVHR